jgi:hypothetical protein
VPITVEVTLRFSTQNQREITFDLECHHKTRFTEGQNFEIVSPGIGHIRGTLQKVVNRSDGVTMIYMHVIKERGLSRKDIVNLLPQMPEVSNIDHG